MRGLDRLAVTFAHLGVLTRTDPSTACTACAVGTYAGCGSTVCEECVAGFVDSDEDPATPCHECLAVRYWHSFAQGRSECISCAAGRADLDMDSTTGARIALSVNMRPLARLPARLAPVLGSSMTIVIPLHTVQ